MTDVHFRPAQEMVGGTQAYQTSTTTTVTGAPIVREEHDAAAEMAAFERGRMQGEMEAIRRLEAEQNSMVLKQFPVEQAAPVIVAQPDVVEINRLTWPQRIAAGLGEAASLAYIALAIIWAEVYHGSFGWTNSNNGDASADTDMWNTHLLTEVLGLFFLAQAILLYRVLPLRTPAIMNRALYTFNYLAAVTCFSLSLAAYVKTEPGTTYWSVDQWCFALGLAVVATHMIYSLIYTWTRPRHVDYEHWAEVNNRVTYHQSPEQRRDHSIANDAGRSVYAPQPHFGNHMHMTNTHSVPAAPAMAPRWAELPHNHQEDYFLVPRAKWAVCGFFAMGAAILMDLAHLEHTLASNSASTWSQDGNPERADRLDQGGREAGLLGAIGIIMLAAVLCIAYAAMPPRTTLVKNSVLAQDGARRASVSHNAETRIGHEQHIV